MRTAVIKRRRQRGTAGTDTRGQCEVHPVEHDREHRGPCERREERTDDEVREVTEQQDQDVEDHTGKSFATAVDHKKPIACYREFVH